MTTRGHFRQLVTERHQFPRGSFEWNWRTAAARDYLAILRKPITAWRPQ